MYMREIPPPSPIQLRSFTKEGGNKDEIQGIAVVAKEWNKFEPDLAS